MMLNLVSLEQMSALHCSLKEMDSLVTIIGQILQTYTHHCPASVTSSI